MQKELFENNFKDIYLAEDARGNPVFCYRTGLTVYEEIFDRGRLVSAGWNDAGTPQNVLEGMPERLDYDAFTEPWSFEAEANGESGAWSWRYLGFEKREETVPGNGAHLLHGIVTLKNDVFPLRVEVHTLLSGSAVFTRYLTLRNDGEEPLKINKLVPMSGGMEIFYDWTHFIGSEEKEKLYDLGYMENANPCAEGLFRWHPMSSCGTSIFGRYRNDRFRYPMFMLRNNPLGHIYFAQMAFSGGYEFSFDLDADIAPNGIAIRDDRVRAKLDFKMALSGPAPLLVLEPGEVFTSPEIYIGRIHGDLDDAVNAMHRHTRKAVFTHAEPEENIATVGAGIGPERAMTSEAILHTLETAAAVGAESLILDAGWYCPAGKEGSEWVSRVGYWFPDPEKHGDRFRAIREKCHEYGMKFGLWMECERMGKDTPVAKEHPAWFQRRRLPGGDTTVIDMANPEAAAWVKSEIERIINEYGIDLFRLDYNVQYDISIASCRKGGVEETSYLRYYKAVYDMFASLREKYPHIVFENCASGGARCDLGMVKHFTHTWISDYQIPPRNVAITNGITMVLPPERVDRLVAGMNGHLRGTLDFTVRSTLFGKPTTNTYNPLGSRMNPGEIAFVRRSFTIYKDFVRPYLTDGLIFHHTPELYEIEPRGRAILERASADRKKGMIGIFNLANISPAEDTVTVFPRGIDPGLSYEVTFDNSLSTSRIPGFTLINDGIRIRLPSSLTSELLLYSAVEE